MRVNTNVVRWIATAMIAIGGVLAARPGLAQSEPPLLLVLDRSAVDHGDETHLIPSDAANEAIAAPGLRDVLPYFAARIGETVTLPGGHDASAGWFAISTVSPGWASDPSLNDGLENFVVAGAGLGSPDANDDRTSLLTNVSDVVAMGAADLGLLAGRTVCAVVYRDDIMIAPGEPPTADLTGATLGLVAFQVTGVDGDGSQWAAMTVKVLDVHETCGGALAPFASPGN
jgi:hypothetical protein